MLTRPDARRAYVVIRLCGFDKNMQQLYVLMYRVPIEKHVCAAECKLDKVDLLGNAGGLAAILPKPTQRLQILAPDSNRHRGSSQIGPWLEAESEQTKTKPTRACFLIRLAKLAARACSRKVPHVQMESAE